MALPNEIGTIAAICTTGAFGPQILKIRKQGGDDLSYAMLGVYFVGVALWLAYGLMIHAAAIIWANAAGVLLVGIAILLKATHPSRRRISQRIRNADTSTSLGFLAEEKLHD
jgi:MtN3 and saliva related transmembrane protein